MYNLKNILSLPVLSLYEGELIGQISKVYFDKKLKKVVRFEIYAEGDIKYCILPNNIYKIGKNAITIKNNSSLVLDVDCYYPDSIFNPLELKAYTILGEYIGKIDKLYFNEKYYVTDIILDNSKVLTCKELASCSKNTIIVYDENTKVRISRFKNKLMPKIFKTNQNAIVTAIPLVPTPEVVNTSTTLPNTATNNPKFLIGRITTQDIMLDNKKLLIKAQSTITEKVLSLACSHNKIKELMLYSKEK